MNLLTDPLLRVETQDGEREMNLPQLLESLGRDDVENLPGIQRHQADAFHVFLCYVAGAVLARAGEKNPVQSQAFWRDGLRALAGRAADEAWQLVGEDLSKPAFMQPPLPASDHRRLRPKADTPDALDLLVTAKNHDVKQSRASRPHLDSWIYALVSVQTMDGYAGSGNRGISRMNSGYGNRAVVELVRSQRPGGRWCDAVVRLLLHRKDVLAGPYGYDPNGLVLLWTEPWDGAESLPLSRLDPFYVEICRRIRLRPAGDGPELRADFISSRADRIAAKDLRGIVGDAWLPIDLGSGGDKKEGGEKALTVSPAGLTPELLRRLVFGDRLVRTPLHHPLPDWQGTLWLRVSVLVRGQGITEGFHEREIPIPQRVRRRLFGGSREEREVFADLARAATEAAGMMQNRVLKPAVFTYLQGAPEKLKLDREAVVAWWTRCEARFESLWSDAYFPWLWSRPDDLDTTAELGEWTLLLYDHARTVLREVEDSMPSRAGRTYRARTRAEQRLRSALYTVFPWLKEGGNDSDDGGSASRDDRGRAHAS